MTLLEAEENLLPLAKDYILPIKFVILSFLFTQLMAAYLRNDGNPGLATKAVLIGGIFNIFKDYFFVFTMDQGIFVTQKGNRIHQTLRYALITEAVFGVLWTVLVELSPNLFIHIFMKPTEHILSIFTKYHSKLWYIFLVIAVQYILYILFPSFDAAKNIIYYFRFKSFRDQWNLNLCTTTIYFSECDMVCDAYYRVAHIHFRCGSNV